MMEVFKLASNPKFREGAKRVVEELKKAGVDINSEVNYPVLNKSRMLISKLSRMRWSSSV